MKMRLFSYNFIDTPIHRLSGLTKLICFLLLTFAVMFSYDIRVILAVMAFSLGILRLAQIKFSQIRLMVIYVLIFLVTNAIISFFFAPEQGVSIYGTRHEFARLFGIGLTWEQVFYQVTKFFKYASVIPFGIIFLLTTNPSEFASALNAHPRQLQGRLCPGADAALFPRHPAGVSRHQPGAAGARAGPVAQGEADRPLQERPADHHPLIFSSLDRIELISNAMDLRGFAKSRTRTWYTARAHDAGGFRRAGGFGRDFRRDGGRIAVRESQPVLQSVCVIDRLHSSRKGVKSPRW